MNIVLILGSNMKSYIFIAAGILALIAIPIAQAQLKQDKSKGQNAIAIKHHQPVQISTEDLVRSAPVIFIAEVINDPLPTQVQQNPQQIRKLDLERELRRVREGRQSQEERVYSNIKLTGTNLIHLKTTQTLKGPKTALLRLPMTDPDFNAAQVGDLFLIMLGTQHQDAVKAIKSVDDNWVKQVKSFIE